MPQMCLDDGPAPWYAPRTMRTSTSDLDTVPLRLATNAQPDPGPGPGATVPGAGTGESIRHTSIRIEQSVLDYADDIAVIETRRRGVDVSRTDVFRILIRERASLEGLS